MWEQGCKFIQDSFLIARFQYKEFRYSEVRLYKHCPVQYKHNSKDLHRPVGANPWTLLYWSNHIDNPSSK